MIKIIIADDHLLFIDGLKMLLANEPGLQVSEVAADGRELMDIIHRQTFDLLLLDINMPKINGLDVLKHIRQSQTVLKIIMLSTYNEDHLVEKAMQYGANGYLLKNSNRQELLYTIRLVIDGKACFPYRSPKLITAYDGKDDFLKQFDLTKRELEIIQFLKNNYTNQQIADSLFLSIYTIETHRKNIMQKLGLNNPAALMKFIIEKNL
jgi:DNA-binding NarL/FixJ family response regulator